MTRKQRQARAAAAGRAAAANMTAEARTERARRAAAGRWKTRQSARQHLAQIARIQETKALTL